MRNIPARQLVTIATLIAMLVAVLVMQQRCGSAVGNLFTAIGGVGVDGGTDGGSGARATSDLTSVDTPRK